MTAHSRRTLRLLLPLLGIVALLLAGAGAASAHAYLQNSTPAQGSVLARSPIQVRLHFSEDVGLAEASVQVLDAAGGDETAGEVEHPFNLGSDLAVPLKASLPDGSYLVVWHVVSDDSHPTGGQFSFSVGKAGSVATASVASGPDRQVSSLLGFARLLGFVGVAAFLGGVGFLVLCWRGGGGSRATARTLQGGWLLAFVGALGSLLLQGPYGSGQSAAHVLDWSLVHGVLQTRYGQALLARVLLLVVASGAAVLVVRRRSYWPVMVVLGLATLVTFPYTGHPSVGSQVPVAVASDVLHLTAMCLWLGGLLMLCLVVLPEVEMADARPVVARFSPVAMGAVVVLVVTGTYQAWREAGIGADLTSTRYGTLLLVKIALVVVVICVAEFSRRWVAAGSGGLRSIGLSVAGETAIVVVILAVTSLLVSGVPARTDYRPSSDLHLVAGPVHLELTVRPSASRVVDVRVDTTDASGKPLAVDEVTVSLSLSSPVAGPLNVKLAPIGQTQFQATGVQLPYTGRWTVTLIPRQGLQEYTGKVSLDVR